MPSQKDIYKSTSIYLAHKLNRVVSEHLEIIARVSAGLACLNCSVGRHCLSWTGRLIKMRNGGKKEMAQSLRWSATASSSLPPPMDLTLFFAILCNHNSKSYF